MQPLGFCRPSPSGRLSDCLQRFSPGSLTCWGARLQPGTGALLVTDVRPVDVLRVGEAQLRVPPDIHATQQDLCGRDDILTVLSLLFAK